MDQKVDRDNDEPDFDAILNCNSSMKYASYQLTPSFPESILNGDMSMIYRQEQWTASQDVHPIWASISRRTNHALYFHLVQAGYNRHWIGTRIDN